jgi:hypothetical protein
MTQRKLSDNDRKDIQRAANAVLQMCDWSLFPEGKEYWDGIYGRLSERAHYGTTDGKPYETPPLTDKDAKNRIFVMAWDHNQYASGPYKLIDILANGVYVLRSKDNCSVLMYAYARRATDEEIRQYIQSIGKGVMSKPTK